MSAILKYIEGFIVLFLTLKLLIHMVPKEDFQKYIRFFAEMVLAFGLLSPMLRYIGDEEAFLNLVEYNEFMEGLEEAAMNAERIEYMQNDYYVREYEKAIERNVEVLAGGKGFAVKEVSVSLSGRYEIKTIYLVVTDQGTEDIMVEKVRLGESGSIEEDASCQELREALSDYYQLEESQITLLYE